MKKTPSIRNRLQELGVAAVYLFGSRAQDLHRSDSDFDIGILLEKSQDPALLGREANSKSLRSINKSGDIYQDLYELFSDFYRTMSDIDIVFLRETTGQLRYHVVKNGKILFDLNPKMRHQFEELTILEHADFESHRKLFEKHLLNSIP
ncbi:MAG: nucleotidyltransferase domain-containing protein [Deltaproteobacteria bacterium]|nr:nucleotidyltransferase domain-containing protein [Deltaproteobacteria bacterium]